MSCIPSQAGKHLIANKQTVTLADVFAEDSECERTFYGFSDDEVSQQQKHDECSNGEDEAELDLSPKEQKATSKPFSGATTFKLRIALCFSSSIQQSSGEEEKEEEEEQEEQQQTKKRGVRKTAKARPAKRMRRIRFEDEEAPAVVCPSPTEKHESDSADDEADSFLAKRQQNIKANKAMLAQLMADLQKMPGGAGLLKKQASKQKTKEKSSCAPRSVGETRKLPERASRRLTRSMGGAEEPTPKEEEMEFSLEEELLEVRRAPQRRGAPRPNTSKPHVVRPVDDITEDELQLIAENMTDKIYNRVTGSTCHQCRQKTVDTKTHCRSEDCRGIQGQFCGPCLRNRYGEDVKKALLDPEWKCLPCRGICNCSFCRQREGRCPTGILFPLAQYHGFSAVHSYLSSLRNKLKKEADKDVDM